MYQESSIIEAVEKQLQGNVQISSTPLMNKKTPIENSTTPISGNIRQMTKIFNAKILCFGFYSSETGSTNSKLSTFSTGAIKTNVQMRRTTNKKGKTAPAPPKRTR